MNLSPKQRLLLTLAAVFGLLGPNGVFLYYALFRRDDLLTAMRDPVTLAFVIEAFLVVALLAWYFAWRPLGRWGWKLFVVLSLVGGLGFGIPAFLLLNARTTPGEPRR
jgi:hypothetical protein